MWVEVDQLIVPLTREVAKQHSELPHLSGDRDTTSRRGAKRILWLESKLRKGTLFSPCWGVAELDGKWWRVDGGHSSKMLANTSQQIPGNLKVIIRRFLCDSVRDLQDLFLEFDPRLSSRTLSDKMKATACTYDDLSTIPPSDLREGTAGIAFCKNNGEVSMLDEDERAALIHRHQDFLSWVSPLIKKRYMRGVGCVAAMYKTFNLNRDVATLFWEQVRDESAPKPADPTRVFASYLLACKFAEKSNRPSETGNRAQYVKAHHAWNAWQTNSTTTLRYNESLPIPSLKSRLITK